MADQIFTDPLDQLTTLSREDQLARDRFHAEMGTEQSSGNGGRAVAVPAMVGGKNDALPEALWPLLASRTEGAEQGDREGAQRTSINSAPS